MEKIGIVVDSGCDVGNVDYPLKVVPLRIFVNGKEYNDGEIDEEFLFENLDGEVKTSLPNPEAIRQVMLDFINEGYKKIITFNISSNLSGTFNLFRLISQELMEKFDDVKIVNIDTLNISVGSGLIVRKCIEYIHSGSLFEDVVEKSKEDIEKSKVFYVIPTLKYLARGGRIGKVKAMLGEFLKMKPVISVNKEGEYYTVTKAHGFKKSINAMYEEFLKFVSNKKFISIVATTGNSESVKRIKESLLEKIRDIENCVRAFESEVSTVLSAHTGPDLVGVAALILD